MSSPIPRSPYNNGQGPSYYNGQVPSGANPYAAYGPPNQYAYPHPPPQYYQGHPGSSRGNGHGRGNYSPRDPYYNYSGPRYPPQGMNPYAQPHQGYNAAYANPYYYHPSARAPMYPPQHYMGTHSPATDGASPAPLHTPTVESSAAAAISPNSLAQQLPSPAPSSVLSSPVSIKITTYPETSVETILAKPQIQTDVPPIIEPSDVKTPLTTSIDAVTTAESEAVDGQWAIWSRRPTNPAQAPGIIISTRAKPPSSVTQKAFTTVTPPRSPPPETDPTPPLPREVEQLQSVAETVSSEDTPSRMSLKGSPISSHTSISELPSPTVKNEILDVVPLNLAVVAEDEPAAETPKPPSPSPPSSPQPQVKAAPKSWASLLKPATSSTSSSARPANALPTSSVIGFSIPGESSRHIKTPSASDSALAKLLETPPSKLSAVAPKIKPRGLINTGNLCFANTTLQVLVYTPPFHNLFHELGKFPLLTAATPVVGKEKEPLTNGSPLVASVIDFFSDFDWDLRQKAKAKKRAQQAQTNGESSESGQAKGKKKQVEEEEEEDEAFIPTKIYNVIKEKKRFDGMRGGQQEDAEEFFGFLLDTLEEELLSIAEAISPMAHSRENAVTSTEIEEPAPTDEGDGWLEVGRKNRTVMTRTVKIAESPITRIFGGKFRSTVRAPGQKDSSVIEDWRAIQLDIQREQVRTVKDALSTVSIPQSVQVASPTHPGQSITASQQVLIESLPPVLVLHLKRFLYDPSAGGVVKIGKQISIAPDLEIGGDIMVGGKKNSGARYKLYAVLYHHGLSATGGHYTVDVLHPNRDNTSPPARPRESWIRLDDDIVSDLRPDQVFNASSRDDKTAYLLFYRRL